MPEIKKYYDHISIAKRTKQIAHPVQEHDKETMIEQILKENQKKQIVIVTNTKRSANDLSTYLKSKEIQATAIHGNSRVSIIEDSSKEFNNKNLNIIITTDMILQSLELSNIEIIISYDIPNEAQNYFSRLKFVDEIGTSICLVTPEDDKALQTIEFLMKLDMQQEELQGFSPTPEPRNTKLNKAKKNKPRHKKKKTKKDTRPKYE